MNEIMTFYTKTMDINYYANKVHKFCSEDLLAFQIVGEGGTRYTPVHRCNYILSSFFIIKIGNICTVYFLGPATPPPPPCNPPRQYIQ